MSATPTSEPDELRFHPLTGDPDFAQMPLRERLLVLTESAYQKGWGEGWQAARAERDAAQATLAALDDEHRWVHAFMSHPGDRHECDQPPCRRLNAALRVEQGR